MDTSEIYMKMCKKAEEIQEHSLRRGDFFFSSRSSKVKIYATYAPKMAIHPTWLPRQDQLQAIVGDYNTCLEKLYWWVEQGTMKSPDGDDYWGYNRSQFTSMEQLWLAYVMKEKYNKVWDGENWN